jgi:hypothetical protein
LTLDNWKEKGIRIKDKGLRTGNKVKGERFKAKGRRRTYSDKWQVLSVEFKNGDAVLRSMKNKSASFEVKG